MLRFARNDEGARKGGRYHAVAWWVRPGLDCFAVLAMTRGAAGGKRG